MTLNKDALASARDRLLEEEEKVKKELEDLGADPEGGVHVGLDEGFADAAQTTSERSKVMSLVEGLLERLESVRAALKKVEAGTYGKCERCGNEIDAERLEAIPGSRLCISCAQRG